ncbi:RNA polymerase sigma factor [Streptomyces gardneri]|uniref:RNA polymerase sigma factor n=1 Tax=Streptomyces gardneri TaxID=66892 RepID=UPI0033ED252A
MTLREGSAWEADSSTDAASASQAHFLALYPSLYQQITAYLRHGSARLDRFDAEDAAAELLLRAAKDWERIGNLANPVGYLLTAARNLAIDMARQRQRMTPTEEGALYALLDRVPPTDFSDEGLSDVVREAVDSMRPSKRRQVVSLQSHGLTDAEIAATLGISQNQVYVQRHRAVRELREKLASHIRTKRRQPREQRAAD